jgi:hypothetical protein
MRRSFKITGFLGLMLLLGAGGTGAANAQGVHFHYTGGHWSHGWHSGWHRYWGGPSIGFYYAPTPVYVVPGYDDYSYYSGPDYWYSNPSFGLSVNIGGGGGWHDRDWHGHSHGDYGHGYSGYNYSGHSYTGHGNYGQSYAGHSNYGGSFIGRGNSGQSYAGHGNYGRSGMAVHSVGHGHSHGDRH